MNYREAIKNYKPMNMEEAQEKAIILQYLEEKADVALTREASLAHITATAMVYNEARDKILMIHHNIYDTWACVGGHADGDYDLMAVAMREVAEETGVTCAVPISEDILCLDILQVQTHEKRGVYVPNHLHLNATYAFWAEEGAPLRVKADENSAVMWIPIEALKSRCKEDSFVKVYDKMNDRVLGNR